MDIMGFRRINDGDIAAKAWQQEVEQAAGRGMALTVNGGRVDEATGNFDCDTIEVRDAETGELLGRFTADEFSEVNFDHEGWFDANGPYEPQG